MQTSAADRYILGELSAAEADSFEEHFFDCPECADEVRIGAAFLEGGRKLAKEPKAADVVPIHARRERRTWLPAALAAMILLAVGVPLLLRQTAAPRPSLEVPRVHTLESAVRAAASDGPTVASGDLLYVDVLAEVAYARYELRVLDAKGALVMKRDVTAEQAGDSLPLVLRNWPGGTYEVVVAGTDAAGRQTEISRHRFHVQG